jgi:hypothetical protein
MAKSRRNELKRHVFEIRKLAIRRCLEPSGECSQPAIHAHSIQNANVLDLLCKDGHVIMPVPKVPNDNHTISFELVGRNKATTFTGLCSQHDDAIFKPIDKGPLDSLSAEHLFLLAYRSVIREVHATMDAASKIQSAYRKKVELELARGDVPTLEGMRALDAVMNAYCAHLYKGAYDEAYRTRNFGQIGHLRIFEADRVASVAVKCLVLTRQHFGGR